MRFSCILLCEVFKTKIKRSQGSDVYLVLQLLLALLERNCGPLEMECLCRRQALPSPVSVAHIHASQKT